MLNYTKLNYKFEGDFISLYVAIINAFLFKKIVSLL